MIEQFKGFIGYKEEEFKELWKESVFVVDTNILINFYKYTTKESTKNLLGILKELKKEGRLWIPHQVALEYFFNYEDNMSKQHEGFNSLQIDLVKFKENVPKILSTVKSQHPYIPIEKFEFFIEDINITHQKLEERIRKEIEKLPDSKEIHQDLIELMDGIIGSPYSQDEINNIEKNGKIRYQYNVPPGFEDKDDKKKQGYRTYGDFRYQQLYGDLIVWHQIMDRAKKDGNKTSMILITEDRKEDWWDKDGSKIKRPHPQLIQEFINKTQQKFYMYRTDNFVSNARKYLDVGVTEEQVKEVSTEIENIRKLEDMKVSKVRNDEWISEWNVNNIKIQKDDIYNYLSEDEIQDFNQMLVHASELTGITSRLFYNRAYEGAFDKALPRMEAYLKNLVLELSENEDVEVYNTMIQRIINILPDKTDERVAVILNEICKFEEKYYGVHPLS
ncbi:PIN-like domain-containing protein [Lysinibacillus xylanilyticus]|uniref:PIN-like domain-containing protein n=1 Tax=Lysinibacillus xylanilyticus TaxID=582475 RepID=UPI003813DBBA